MSQTITEECYNNIPSGEKTRLQPNATNVASSFVKKRSAIGPEWVEGVMSLVLVLTNDSWKQLKDEHGQSPKDQGEYAKNILEVSPSIMYRWIHCLRV